MSLGGKAVCLLSGGLDSAVALAVATRQHGRQCRALSFSYGQRHRVELVCAKQVAQAMGVPHETYSLPHLAGSALTGHGAVPDASDSAAIPVTYVPGRNTLFVAVAASVAEAWGARAIYTGFNAIDYSGYPDCRPAYVQAFNRLFDVGTKCGVQGTPLRLLAPLVHMRKSEIVTLGDELGAPLGFTWSCYRGGVAPCRKCDSCVIRARAFAEAQVPEPSFINPFPETV